MIIPVKGGCMTSVLVGSSTQSGVQISCSVELILIFELVTQPIKSIVCVYNVGHVMCTFVACVENQLCDH